MEPAGVDIRAGVDAALHDDGGGGMAGLAEWGMADEGATLGALSVATGVECGVVALVFRISPAGFGIDRHLALGRCDYCDIPGVLPGPPDGRAADVAVFAVGGLRFGAEFHALVDESGVKGLDRLRLSFRLDLLRSPK